MNSKIILKHIINVKFLCGYLLLLILNFCVACSQNENHVSADAQGVFNTYDSLMEVQKYSDAISTLQNNFNENEATDYDRLTYYQLVARYYSDVPLDLKSTEIYLDSFEMLMPLFENLNSEKLGFYYLKKAKLAGAKQDYDQAFYYFYKCKQLLDVNVDFKNKQYYTNELAVILFKEGYYTVAKDYFKEVYSIGTKHPDLSDFGYSFLLKHMSLNNVGVAFERMNELDSASFYYNMALDVVEKNLKIYPEKLNRIEQAKAITNGNLGGVYVKQKKYTEALSLLAESINTNLKEGYDKNDAILTKIKLAQLYNETHRYDSCFRLITEVEKYLSTSTNVEALYRVENLKYSYFIHIKDFAKAISANEKRLILNDSLKVVNKKGYTKENFIKYNELVKSQIDLELYKSSNRVKSIYLYSAAALIVMCTVLIYVLLRVRKQQKTHIEKLRKLNLVIASTNNQLQESLNSLELLQEDNKRYQKLIVHDLRSPLTSILSLINLIKIEEKTNESVMQYIDLVEKSGNKAMLLIAEILKKESNNTSLETKVTSLESILSPCIQMYQSHALKKQISITTHIEMYDVNVNVDKMWRVFSNILANAIKFSNNNSVITISTHANDKKVLIVFKDEGIGIPLEKQKDIFNTYAMKGQQGTSGEVSYGMGMFICKQIVEAHGGKIWFDSIENKGTTFYVELDRVVE